MSLDISCELSAADNSNVMSRLVFSEKLKKKKIKKLLSTAFVIGALQVKLLFMT